MNEEMFVIPCFKNSFSLYVKHLCTCTHVSVAQDIQRNEPVDKNLFLSGGNTRDFSSFCLLPFSAKVSYYENE